MENAAGEPVTVLASAPGYLPLSRTVSVAERETLTLDLVSGGEPLRGQVSDASGGAIVAASVTAEALGADVATAISDLQGQFELYLPLGAHRIRVHADGYSENAREVWAPSSGVNVVLAPASSLEGRVVAEGSGAPIAEVAVHAFNTNAVRARPVPVQTDLDGSFRFGGLPAGNYALLALGPGWRSSEQSVTLELNQAGGPVTIEASPATTLTGQVSVSGSPCGDGRVNLSGPVSVSEVVSSDGTVLLEGLLPGLYEAQVLCPPGAPHAEQIQVGAEPVARAWDLETGLRVRGVVETALGEPVAGAEVLVAASADGPEQSNARCVSDAAGEFECPGLLAGLHDCWLASSYPNENATVQVALAAGKDPLIRLQSNGSGTIRVTFEAAPNVDLASVNPMARRVGAPAVSGRLNGRGFVFEGLELGDYELFLEPSLEPAARVTLTRLGQVVDVELPEPRFASISGRVLDEENAPVVDAWVHVRPAGSDVAGIRPFAPTLTDDQGAFSLAELIPGPYDLEVNASSGRARLPGVTTGQSPVVVRLTSHASVRVHVTSVDGEPIEQFALAYQRENDMDVTVAEGKRGLWLSPNLTPGVYELSITSQHGAATRRVEASPASHAAVTIEVQPEDD